MFKKHWALNFQNFSSHFHPRLPLHILTLCTPHSTCSLSIRFDLVKTKHQTDRTDERASSTSSCMTL